MVCTYPEAEKLLQTYSLDDILEMNELTDSDVLFYLIKHQVVEIPEPRPVDLLDG